MRKRRVLWCLLRMIHARILLGGVMLALQLGSVLVCPVKLHPSLSHLNFSTPFNRFILLQGRMMLLVASGMGTLINKKNWVRSSTEALFTIMFNSVTVGRAVPISQVKINGASSLIRAMMCLLLIMMANLFPQSVAALISTQVGQLLTCLYFGVSLV